MMRISENIELSAYVKWALNVTGADIVALSKHSIEVREKDDRIGSKVTNSECEFHLFLLQFQ